MPPNYTEKRNKIGSEIGDANRSGGAWTALIGPGGAWIDSISLRPTCPNKIGSGGGSTDVYGSRRAWKVAIGPGGAWTDAISLGSTWPSEIGSGGS